MFKTNIISVLMGEKGAAAVPATEHAGGSPALLAPDVGRGHDQEMTVISHDFPRKNFRTGRTGARRSMAELPYIQRAKEEDLKNEEKKVVGINPALVTGHALRLVPFPQTQPPPIGWALLGFVGPKTMRRKNLEGRMKKKSCELAPRKWTKHVSFRERLMKQLKSQQKHSKAFRKEAVELLMTGRTLT
ncbi:MAG TPA: hypothetical protein VG347_04115, partial [Verrucomicrobiae bacterium]|nr:hypothetical protein [Verrucomicrobiae bacterium]